MRRTRWHGWVLALAWIFAAPALAADPGQATSAPDREMRREMAAVHRKMAECLESERPFEECRTEMMRTCHEKMGESGCPMMWPMKHGPQGMPGHGSSKSPG